MNTVFFDLDGTLCDSSEGIFNCFRYSFRKMGLPDKTDEELLPYIGPPLLDSYIDILGERKEAERGVNIYRERYAVYGWRECRLYEGVKECLAFLRRADVRVGLATSKPQVFAEKILKNFCIDGYFNVVAGSRLDNSFDGKAEILAYGMALLSAAPADCAMVGDREQDIYGAKKNGVLSVGICTGFAREGELEGAGADYIVKDFADLTALLGKIVIN